MVMTIYFFSVCLALDLSVWLCLGYVTYGLVHA